METKEMQNNILPFSAVWHVKAEWAHPFWDSYIFMLVDLTTPFAPAPVLYAPDMTHEFHLYATNPDTVGDLPFGELSAIKVTSYKLTSRMLDPPNYVYQFNAVDNTQAKARILHFVNEVKNKQLNPDTDARTTWDRLFSDGEKLVNRRRR